MSKQSDLVKKKCIPCEGGVPPLEQQAIATLLTALDGTWTLNEQGHLVRSFTFKDFVTTMDFANQVADLAEQEGHHPELTLSYGACVVEVWTHKIAGLTESDFILAAKISALFAT